MYFFPLGLILHWLPIEKAHSNSNNIHHHSGLLLTQPPVLPGRRGGEGGATERGPTESDAKGEGIIFASWKKKKNK